MFCSSWKDEYGGTSLATQCNAGDVGSIPGQGAKISHALRPKHQNIKQKQYCNKFNKDLKNGLHQNKKKISTVIVYLSFVWKISSLPGIFIHTLFYCFLKKLLLLYFALLYFLQIKDLWQLCWACLLVLFFQ